MNDTKQPEQFSEGQEGADEFQLTAPAPPDKTSKPAPKLPKKIPGQFALDLD